MENQSLFSDVLLFKKISEGSDVAFRLIFERYYHRMLSFSEKTVKSIHAAEEIVQEAFIRLWEHRDLLVEIKNPKDYLFIVTRNLAFNYLRDAAREQNRRERLWDALTQRITSTPVPMEAQEAEQLLKKIMEQLSPQQRKIFLLSRDEGFSHQRIADELHLSKNTVKKHMTESLKVFKSHIKQSGLFSFIFFLP